MDFRFLPILVLAASPSFAGIVRADDVKIRDEIERLRASVTATNERIAELEASIDNSELSPDFAWSTLGTRLKPCPKEIEAYNRATGSRYRGAVIVTEVRPESPAASAGIKVGDLLLSIAGLQATDLDDVRRFGARHEQLAATGKAKFYIVRNQQALFGHLGIPQLPPTSDR